MARGSLNRQVGATDMNSKSSRSHAIFSLTMSQQKLVNHNGYNSYSKSPTPGSRPTTPSSKLLGSRANSRLDSRFDDDGGDWITITSKFHFVDLAGSERVSYIFQFNLTYKIFHFNTISKFFFFLAKTYCSKWRSCKRGDIN